ncbi:MAG TPA: precorrin-8X methylmutase [Nitrososphaeraceae archaeon]|jgi:precorrin-8X/cobalt-precorrin-8 methylmutase
MSNRSLTIEQKSFEIIDTEVGQHGYSQIEWNIVRRVIHSTADFDFARKNGIIFRNGPIKSALLAIKRKCAIVTDVEMVLSGINKNSMKKLGIKASCHISERSVVEDSMRMNKTRAQLAMRYASSEIHGGIVMVGNAPTSLLEVIKMVRENASIPALIIGTPVGFVSASESKQDLLGLDVPIISNIGRKGGSAVASSIINALMLIHINNSQQ